MNNLRAAVIGCGRIANGFDEDPKRKIISTHIGAYQHTPGVELTAVSDLDGQRLSAVCRQRKITKSYTDYRKMLTTENIDIVSVCTPEGTHRNIVVDIARKKLAKAIFCEKPVATSLPQAQAMIEACRLNKVILQINHQRRFDQMHQTIKAKIDKSVWGKAQQVNFRYCSGIKNSGSHMFDLLRFFFGDALWVQAVPSANSSHNTEDPNLDGLVCFNSGLVAHFQAFDNNPYYIFDIDMYFEKARLVVTEAGFSAEFYKLGNGRHFSNSKVFKKVGVPFSTALQSSYMVRGVLEIMDCLHGGRASISSGKEGLRSMQLIELSIRSAWKNGRRMFVPNHRS